jgi:hypothetical protein
MIGVNTRFETSILNTTLRKHQLGRDLIYYFIGVYSNLKLKQNHLGISSTKLLEILSNKTNATKELVLTKGSSIFLGSEILKSKNGAILQNLARLLAKRLFLKTSEGDRLGILQGNPTNLIFNHLGIKPSVRSNLYVEEIQDKKIDLLYLYLLTSSYLLDLEGELTNLLALGQILDKEMPAGKYTYFSSIENLASGLYIATIQAQNQSEGLRIIKQK